MMKTRALFPTLLAILAWSGLAYADKDGRTGYSGDPGIRGGLSCEICHTGGAAPTVDITGPMIVTPGSTNTYTLTISGGAGVTGGLDVSATMGLLAAFEAGTKLAGGEITHTAPKPFDSSGNVAFSFNWTAPSSPGTAALYGAGLSTNGMNDEPGDEVDTMVLMISVESAPPMNQPPVANPGGPYSAIAGGVVDLNGSGSFDPDGTVTSYTWDFGDGSGGTGAKPSHMYAAAGNYTVGLMVTDDKGADNTATTMADISASPPQNQLPVPSAGGPYSGIVGTPIAFNGSGSVDPDGTVVSWMWDFGDGSNGSGAMVDHTYAAPGVYRVSLTVTDNDAASASDMVDAVVNDPSASTLPVLLRAPRWVKVKDRDRPLTIGLAVDTSSLPSGTVGCGTATLFKNGLPVATESVCMRPADADDEADEDDDDHAESSRREMKVKTPHGVVAMQRPTDGTWMSTRFGVRLSAGDAPSVVWTALVDLMGRTGESTPATTEVQIR